MLSPGAALRRVSGVRRRPGVQERHAWTPDQHRTAARCGASGER
jgi:hypothetical protein